MIAWSEDLETGHDYIDHHHRELFHLISSLDDVIYSHDESQLDDIISYLENYVLSHFEEEEVLMKDHGYEDYDYHKGQHDEFTSVVQDIRKHFDGQRPRTHTIFKIRQFVDDLTHHIQTVDVGMASIQGDTHE